MTTDTKTNDEKQRIVFTETQCLGCYKVFQTPDDVRDVNSELLPPSSCLNCGSTEKDEYLIEPPFDPDLKNLDRMIEGTRHTCDPSSNLK